MRSFICYLGILSMMLISPQLAVNIGADESTVENDSEIVCDFIAKPVQGPSPLTVIFQDRSTGKITVSLTVKGPAGISELVKVDYIKVMAKP